MGASLFIYKDVTISDKDWNTKRFDKETAEKIAAKIKGSEVQYRPADPYYGQKFGQTGQRNEGYVVLAKYGFVTRISDDLLKELKGAG
jgi:hypothetical protein